ncbi:TetR/AcrR family transcriptional regulator [Microbacterium protaetiae]|uniref:TetR/AcrR family transcriptional regulator n=2 Tax=Microbacterium protaetiae TaxID=2509458 RepID=A0A4P6EN10_9MICO|nr:TetR/AcrR family transcriptional regulator [Microbacterium protaetiae]
MPKAIDHDQRRRDIIDVTWKLIVKGGLEAATMREIASEAGFANGALKHYFPGKDDIIQGAYQLSMDRIVERLTESTKGLTGIDAFRAIVRATMPLDAESRDSARVLLAFWERGLSSDTIRDAYQGHLAGWRSDSLELIAQCRAQGLIDTDASDEEIVREMIYMNVGATVLSAITPDFSDRANLEAMIDGFFERLGVPRETGPGSE